MARTANSKCIMPPNDNSALVFSWGPLHWSVSRPILEFLHLKAWVLVGNDDMKTNQRVGKKRVVRIDSGREFLGLKGKVVKRVEIGKGEDHDLYIHVRFRDETELCFWLTSRIVIEEADLGDWKSGDFVQKRAFIQSPMVKAIVKQDALFNKISKQLDREQRQEERRLRKRKLSPDVMTRQAIEWIRETLDYIVTPNEARKFLERLPRATLQLQELTQHITTAKNE